MRDCGADAAAFAGYFFVAGAGVALFVFGSAAGGENQVRVGIDEAGENDATGEIEFFGAARGAEFFDAAAGADGGYAVFADEDGAVADDTEFAEGFAAAGNWAAESQQLRAAGDQPIGHGRLDTNAGRRQKLLRRESSTGRKGFLAAVFRPPSFHASTPMAP